MKKKIIISSLIFLTVFLGFLIVNNIYNENMKNDLYQSFVNKTIKIKEELLNKNDIVMRTIEGKLFIKDNEKLLKNIELILLKEKDGIYEKSSITYTDDNGNYKFTDLEVGNYKINLETNEDYKMLNEENLITITDDILIKTMDIEVSETDIFKAQITKYIKQIKLLQDSKEVVYDYNNQNKVVIPLKNIKNLSGTVEYEFNITNVKSKEGFVKVIKDKLPEGLNFNQDKNPLWKEKNGYLYTTQLSNATLKPNETKKISLILDINNTNEGKAYLNKVSITGEIYHKVTFINLGDIFSELNVLDGDTAVEEIKPVLFGFRFTGWYKDESNTILFDFAEPITEDTKIYAGWQKEINVKYMVDNNLYKEETIFEGETTNKPIDPTKEGYIFDSWYEDEGYNKHFDFKQKLYSDTTIYGKLIENIVSYDVTYIIDGEEFSKETLKSGSKVENKTAPYKENKELSTRVASYQFDGWYEDENYTTRYDFEKGIDKNLILYGKYVETLSCKTINNVRIPSKDKIINSLSYDINKVDLDESNANITLNENHGEHVIIDGFEVEYHDETNSSYKIIGYANTTLPETLVIPDKILNKPVVSITGAFDNLTIDNIKISSTVSDIKTSFNTTIINGNIIFDEAINLNIIQDSFNNSEFKNIDLGNSINLRTIINSFTNSNGDDFYFNNTINLNEISSILKNSTLNSIDLGNSINLISLDEGAFTELTVNNMIFSNTISLESIKQGAFRNSKIYNLDLGNSINLSLIESGSFDYLNIEELNMSKLFSLVDIKDLAFEPSVYEKDNSIKKIILSSTIRNIGNGSFESLEINDVDMECAKDSLEIINSESFKGNNLTEVNITDFTRLNEVNISAYVENPLKIMNFKNLPALSALKISGGNLRFENENEGIIIDNVGITDIDFYGDITNTKLGKMVIQNNPNLITITSAINNENSMDEIIIQNNPKLETIGRTAFYNSSMKRLVMNNLPKLTTIDEMAFHGSNCLSNITIESLPSLEVIGKRAFSSFANPLGIDYKEHNIILKNLSNLTMIGEEAFMRRNIKEINLLNLPSLETIGKGAFYYNDTSNFVLTGDNLPNLTSIGLDAFKNEKGSIKNIVLKDLLKLDGILENWFTNGPEYNNIDSIDIENLPLLKGLSNGNFLDYVKKISIKNCEKFDLGLTMMFNLNQANLSNNISTLILENLPSTTKISNLMFYKHNIKELDLTKMGNLQEIGLLAFAGNPLEIVKLPETLTTIGNIAFSSYDNSGSNVIPNNTIKCIEIMGDNTRFNNIWNQIGLPNSLTPSTCAFTTNNVNIVNVLSASILDLKNENMDQNIYNIVLYKMDNNELIDNSKTYKLEKLTSDDFSEVGVLEDIENVGRYIIDSNSKDVIKSFNNKVYLSNITQGTYKLVDNENSDNKLTFIVESNGEITGNAKISFVNNSDKIMSSSEAEFITNIKTGNDIKNYFGVLLLLSVIVLFTLSIKKVLK